MKKQIFSLLILTSLVACSSGNVSLEISVKPLEANIEIHSDLVKEYFAQENYDYKDMNAYINAKTDLGDNLPIHFSWETANLKEG